MSGNDNPSVAMEGSPFHEGERRVQARLGHAQRMERIGPRVIRPWMPEQHQAFFAAQHLLFMGSADAGGRPWVSVLAGPPGFVHAPDARHLRVSAAPAGGAPGVALQPDQRVGLLGIDYSSRRRNRLNGRVQALDRDGFTLAVEHSFGNCPRYIQMRSTRLPAGDAWRLQPPRPEAVDLEAPSLRRLLHDADHFYIATHHLADGDDPRDGVDVSHRGGRPGFVRMDDDGTLVFPDFAGNRFFNTLGNIEANGLAGLGVVDFHDGSLFALTGQARVDWNAAAEKMFAGAERLVRFLPTAAWRHPRLLPFSWTFLERSPALDQTATWVSVTP